MYIYSRDATQRTILRTMSDSSNVIAAEPVTLYAWVEKELLESKDKQSPLKRKLQDTTDKKEEMVEKGQALSVNAKKDEELSVDNHDVILDETIDWADHYDEYDTNIMKKFENFESRLELVETKLTKLRLTGPLDAPKMENRTYNVKHLPEGIINVELDLNKYTAKIHGDKTTYGFVVGKGQSNVNRIMNRCDLNVSIPRIKDPSNEIICSGNKDIHSLLEATELICLSLHTTFRDKKMAMK